MKIQFQIVERPGEDLRGSLISAMRTGGLQTFIVRNRGRKVTHVSRDYPGWMNWKYRDGVMTCRVLSPNKPGKEWKLFHAFIGRLADRFAGQIHSINIQFLED
jgi:hypothetical protein